MQGGGGSATRKRVKVMMTAFRSDVGVRGARSSDAAGIAELSGQLGYPATEKQMKARLGDVLKDKDAACFVADAREDGLVGWIHVSTTPLLEVERRGAGEGVGGCWKVGQPGAWGRVSGR